MNGPPRRAPGASSGSGSMFFRETTLRVLGFLLESTGLVYGLQIIRGTGVDGGQVYPLLRRLEAAGVVQAVNEVGDRESLGRELRRSYRLTPPAERLLRLDAPST
jgi:DNA-binding PadR family transcriptional regulator